MASVALLMVVLALGCEEEGGQLEGGDAGTSAAGSGASVDGGRSLSQGFESELGGELGGGPGGGGIGGGSGGTGAPMPPVRDPTGMIEDAEIVQLEDAYVYALSASGALNVIDVAVPGELRWLGSYSNPDDAEPFEMYLRSGVALVLYRSWGQPEISAGAVHDQVGRVVALDVRDPEHVSELGSVVVSGIIGDSRLAGDVLYVVSHRDGWCPSCSPFPVRTSIVSIDVSDPSELLALDELHFENATRLGGNAPVFHFAPQRIYLAGGPADLGDGAFGSVIRVVDISDETGTLAEGAVLNVEGDIEHPWQMNEWNDVLRVVTQPSLVGEPQSQSPVAQTFAIESSETFTPLGRTELEISGAARLLTMRFDGERAYATTQQPSDPLFAIDLSDPAAPVARGEVGVPGLLLHLEPRGERLLAFGSDWENPLGSIVVSLFDVSDMQAPAMLGSARFGGSQASLNGEYGSVHAVARVFEVLGLIAVPYRGADVPSCTDVGHAVQLVDWDTVQDELALGASIPVHGLAQRPLVQGDALLTVSDDRLTRLDLGDRSDPRPQSEAAFSRNVTRMIPLASGVVARIDEPIVSAGRPFVGVDFVEAARVESPLPPLSELSSNELLGQPPEACTLMVLYDAFAIEDRLVLLYWTESQQGVLVIDARDAAAPVVLSKTEWTPDAGWTRFSGSPTYGVPAIRSSAAHTAHAVAMLETEDDVGGVGPRRHQLRVVDLDAPEAPSTTVIDLGERWGQSGLLTDDDVLITSHYEPTEEQRARFFLDRWDLSDPSAPRALPPVNVPGNVLHYDGTSARAVTAELTEVDRFDLPSALWQQCRERFATHGYFNGPDDDGVCTGYQQRLHLVHVGEGDIELLDTYEIDATLAVRAYASGDDALYVNVAAETSWNYALSSTCSGPCGEGSSVLIALSGLSGQRMQAASIEVHTDAWWYWWSSPPVYAVGSRVVVVGPGQVQIVDASDPTNLELSTTRVGRSVQHVTATPGAALLSRGFYGARRVELAP